MPLISPVLANNSARDLSPDSCFSAGGLTLPLSVGVLLPQPATRVNKNIAITRGRTIFILFC